MADTMVEKRVESLAGMMVGQMGATRVVVTVVEKVVMWE